MNGQCEHNPACFLNMVNPEICKGCQDEKENIKHDAMYRIPKDATGDLFFMCDNCNQIKSKPIKGGQIIKVGPTVCEDCKKPKMKRDCNTCIWQFTGPNQGPCKSCTPEKSFYATEDTIKFAKCANCEKPTEFEKVPGDSARYYCSKECFEFKSGIMPEVDIIHKMNPDYGILCKPGESATGISKHFNWDAVNCPKCLEVKAVIEREKPEPEKLDQSVFCGKPKGVKFAHVGVLGNLTMGQNMDCCVSVSNKCEYEPNQRLEREFTADGMTYDEALECHKKGELEYFYIPNSSWHKTVSFIIDWNNGICQRGLKLSDYRKKPEVKEPKTFRLELNDFMQHIHQNAKDKGWYKNVPFEQMFSNMCNNLHDEVSELHEAWRNNKLNELCDKAEGMTAMGLTPLTCAEEELADILIRVLDDCKALGIDPEHACRTKHAYNAGRPERHGGKRC